MYGGYGGGYGGYPQMTGMGGMGMGMGYGGGMGGMGDSGFHCVKLRGVPFDSYENDIRMFLGTDAVDVLMCRKGGRMTGEVYVVFPSSYQSQMALAKSGQNMGRRYIEVFPASKQDYYMAIVHTMEGRGAGGAGGVPLGEDTNGGDAEVEHTGILKMRGLPYEATVAEIQAWFKDDAVAEPKPEVKEENVVLCVNFSGRPSGMAFVKFASEDEAKAAYSMNRKNFGRRYVELFPASQDDFEREASRVPPAAAAAPMAEEKAAE